MRRHRLIARVMVLALCAVAAGAGRAQVPASPAVHAATTGEAGAPSPSTVLTRVIALRLERVTLEVALQTIAAQARVRISYSRADIPLDKQVSLVVDSITFADALKLLLRGTGVGAEVLSSGRVALGPVAATPVESALVVRGQPGAGTISGTVVDSVTRASVPSVIIRIEETGQSVQSGVQGRYMLTGVAPGEYRVTARRVGYTAKTRSVVVADGQAATLDFALNRPPTKLDEVVTTAVGDQRRYQVGNDISSINVDSLAPTAPVTSVTDILTARAPGLAVVETGGLTGSGEAIRIRGQSSIALQSDPILIVDGVRQDNAPGGTAIPTFGYVYETPSRLNDIDFSQIATIDVLKGPAASTEYGTDAANGVIVITTKRGTSGRPQWHMSAEQAENSIPTDFPDYDYSWGHIAVGSPDPVKCPLVPLFGSPSSSDGSCVVDSVTHFNPLNHSATSIYGVGTRAKYNVDVGGGTETIRYYLAGGLANETGALRLPPVFVPQARAVGLPEAALKPNGEQQRSVRANTSLRFGTTADVTVSAAYLSTSQTSPQALLASGAGLFAGAAAGGPPDSANFYGYGGGGNGAFGSPINSMRTLGTQQTNRFTGGLTASWRPATWLSLHGDAGIDHGSEQDQSTTFPQAFIYLGYNPNRGEYGLAQTGTDLYSVDLRGAATAPLTHALRAVTTVGLNVRDTRVSSIASYAAGLSAVNLTLVGVPNPSTTQTGTRSATLGGYVEEQLQVADRLFVTGALRVDAASGFGHRYQSATYPKLSVSWLAIQHTATTVRLRGAFGTAGVAPYNGLSLLLYRPVVVSTDNGAISAVQVTQPGNPNLKPERTAEWEGGVDVGLWDNRVSLAFSAYGKTTRDALYSQSLGWDLGAYSYEINIGEIRNNGFEAQVTAIPVETRGITWTTTLSGSINRNKLVHLEAGLPPLFLPPLGAQRITPGYPLYGLWGVREHYTDANHDGIIEPNELTVDTAAVYMGSSLPTRQASFDTHLTLFHGTLSIGALLDYQGGYRVYNSFAQLGALHAALPESNIAGSTLWKQARALAYTEDGAYNAAGFFEDGTVWRFQELSLTCALPARWARAAHVRSLSLTGAIRNLAYWTRYSGGDPSSSEPSGSTDQPSGNTATINNDIRASGSSSVPLSRYYQLRLNVGF